MVEQTNARATIPVSCATTLASASSSSEEEDDDDDEHTATFAATTAFDSGADVARLLSL